MSWYRAYNHGTGIVNVCDGNQHNIYTSDHRGNTFTYSSYGDGYHYSSTHTGNYYSRGPRVTSTGPGNDSIFPALTSAGNPTNHLYVRTGNQSINSAYRIDPTLRIPQSLLSDVAASVPANARNSMEAETQNGSICINVGLALPNNGSTQRLKASLYLRTDNGSVQARIAPTTPRPPFRLSAVSSNGSVSVYIPRSFHGTVSLESGNGTIRLSREVKRDLIVLSEEGGRQEGFIGDLGDYSYDGHTEHGVGMNLDELSLRSGNGMISVYFAQERADDSSENIAPTSGVRAPGMTRRSSSGGSHRSVPGGFEGSTVDDEDEVWYSAEETLEDVDAIPNIRTHGVRESMFPGPSNGRHAYFGGGMYNNVNGTVHTFSWSSPLRRRTR